ncbi:MAG: hypothetical protein HC915_20045, partial [Anaerolineae bacterium]|nr:hypothetical protein [Anaerolineae bacterium]
MPGPHARPSPGRRTARRGPGCPFARSATPRPPNLSPQRKHRPPLEIIEPPTHPENTVSYACVWLLDAPNDPLKPESVVKLKDWLVMICQAHQWDFQGAIIQPDWFAARVLVPRETLPSAVAETLLSQTRDQVLLQEPDRAGSTLWGDGYLITSPAEDLKESDINRFLQFYQRARSGTS